MKILNIPETSVYLDDEHVVAEWTAADTRRRASFSLFCEEGETYAVLARVAVVDGGTAERPDATVEDVPAGVRWAVANYAGVTVGKREESDGGPGRGVA